MKKQWIGVLLVLALAMAACLSMPVMAEQLIDESVDVVTTEEGGELTRERSTLTEEAPGLQMVELSAAAKAKLELDGRKAYENAFGEAIPADYEPLDMRAYPADDGDGLGVLLTLMPKGWEASTDALGSGERAPYYTIQFGQLNAETGEAEVLGLQRFHLYFPDDEVNTPEITDEIKKTLESSAREFAEEKGYNTGKLIYAGTVSGSFEPGLSMEFDIGGGKTLTVNVAVDGSVNGYSLVPGKG